jgi:protein required for attachment to host cells
MTPLRWIVVSDRRTARLLSCREMTGGRWHAEEEASLDSRWENYHEHHRPSALDGPPSPGTRMHASSGFSEMEVREEGRRFARDVAQWLERDCDVIGDDSVTVFAAPRFFGDLRDELGKRHRPTRPTDIHELELTRLRPEELVNHTGVLQALRSEERRPAAS